MVHCCDSVGSAFFQLFPSRRAVGEHSLRTAEISCELGKALGLKQAELLSLVLIGGLHDIGKVAIATEVLDKPGPLDASEWGQMLLHPGHGYRLAIEVPSLYDAAIGILYHHERWDGRGYPLGLRDTDIPLFSRVVCIADAFDAMTNPRPYCPTMSVDAALNELRNQAGQQFDPYLVGGLIDPLRLWAERSPECNGIQIALEPLARELLTSRAWLGLL